MFDLDPGWQIALEALGWIGSAIIVWSMMQQRILRLRRYNLAGCVIQVFYNGMLGVWPVVALNVVLVVIQIVNLVRLHRQRHDTHAYAVVEIDAGSDYLRHLIGLHHEDIARFHPGFDSVPADAEAYLVLNGEETAGYVVLRRGPEAVAQIELDYVTERYRDFTPGEFVFSRSGMLRDKGYLRVVSAPGTVDPYYSQIGFEPAGDRYVLDLTA